MRLGWPSPSRPAWLRRLGHPLAVAAIGISAGTPGLPLHASDRAESPGAALEAVTLHDGPELDYQPEPIQLSDGRLLVVFERLDPRTQFGDLWQVESDDGGASWSEPAPTITSPANERHPALVELAAGELALFYLSDAAGGFRIARARSYDGRRWAETGPLELGWETPGEINPSVVGLGGSRLLLAYQRYIDGGLYTALSEDDGSSWDQRRTTLTRNGQLPRLAAGPDGLLLATYQRSFLGNRQAIYSKTTRDPYAWPNGATPLAVAANSHDAEPLALPGGGFLVTYAEQSGSSAFDLQAATSRDGALWSAPLRLTFETERYDTQPHPLVDDAGRVLLFWSRQDGPSPYQDHDLWWSASLQPPPLPGRLLLPLLVQR